MLAAMIKANVIEYVSASPRHLALIANNPNKHESTTVTSIDGSQFSITDIDITKDLITATFDKDINSTKHHISFKINNKHIKHPHLGRITINIAHPKEKKINVSFAILPEFMPNPGVIKFQDSGPKTKITYSVMITNRLDMPFEIKDATSAQGLIKILKPLPQDNKHQIRFSLAIPQEQKPGIFKDELVISFKERPNTTITIPCYGRLE
jgi:hypothetical protein